MRTFNWLLAAASIPVGQALAAPPEQERILESSRAYGRGNTYVAAFDSDETTRMNPAALGDSQATMQFRWFQLDALIGKNSIDTVSDITELASDKDATAVTFLQQFNDKFGKRQYARVQLAPMAIRVKGVEIMPFASNASFLDMRSPIVPEIAIRSDTLYGANISYGHSIGGELDLGVTVRPLSRIYIAGDMTFSDVVDFLPPTSRELEDVVPVKEGSGVGVDFGATWQPSVQWRFALLVENAGYTSTGEGADAPPPIPQRISLGSLYRWNLNGWHLDSFCDLQDLANREAYHPLRLLHLGAEFGKSAFTRDHDYGLVAGVNEGYLTGGLFADLWLLRIDLTNYAVELGETPGQRMDRRWALSMRTTSTF